MTYTETGIVAAIEQLADTSIDHLTQPELDTIDQYHVGGREAVARMIPSLAVGRGATVLDVGAGLGGPARQIARTSGARVFGVDVTADYVTAATELTRRVGLSGQVLFQHVDIADLDRSGFDAAYTIHVQMNVADKAAFYAQIGARLRQGGRLAVFEVCQGDGSPALPLPWSLDGTDSFLVPHDELRTTIAGSGFETAEWTDESAWSHQWLAEAGRRLVASPSRASLATVLADGPTRLVNFAAAIAAGSVTVHRGSFTRSG